MAMMVFAAGQGVRAAERTLSIETEVLGAKEATVGRVRMLAAARSEETGKGTFGSLTLVVNAEVGPTFDKDCNLVTINAKLEDSEATGINRKRDFKLTIHACGTTTPSTPLPGSGPHRVVVTIRPAP
jgi:hypothetical protein